MATYTNNITLNIISSVTNLGKTTVTAYEWKVNNTVYGNTAQINVDSSRLPLGDNIISLRVQNSCGKWSDLYSQTITIVEVNKMTTQTDPINVNAPTVVLNVKLTRTATVNVTVVDENSVPVASAQVSIAGITGTTDATGKVVLASVPYGSQIATTTIP